MGFKTELESTLALKGAFHDLLYGPAATLWVCCPSERRGTQSSSICHFFLIGHCVLFFFFFQKIIIIIKKSDPSGQGSFLSQISSFALWSLVQGTRLKRRLRARGAGEGAPGGQQPHPSKVSQLCIKSWKWSGNFSGLLLLLREREIKLMPRLFTLK